MEDKLTMIKREEGGSIGKMRMGWQGNESVENDGGNEDAIYWQPTESEIGQVEDSLVWWLASIAVLAFLSIKDVINSN